MNEKNINLASQLVSKSYIGLGQNSINTRENMITTLLSQRSLPEYGWDDLSIEFLLSNLASMDTNNFPGKVGVGERESRIYSSIVNKRNFHMGHGIGRSGDISAIQPKAAGSSLVLKLTKFLAQDAMKIMGIQKIQDLLVLPLATGMSLSLVLLAFQSLKPQAKYVIWSRIDQKTCLKCIKTINLQPVVIELKIQNDELTTNTEEIEKKIEELGPQNILCVLSTTSCFAPRVPDDVQGIAKICKKYDVNHLINNAYGLQCKKITNSLNLANQVGRVDAVVQSTDKNFMVPVGGSIVFSYEKYSQNQNQKLSEEEKEKLQKMSKEEKKEYYKQKNKIQDQDKQKNIIEKISELYPGRASAAPITDLFITLLSMGKNGLNKLLQERQENLEYAKIQIQKFTKKHQERLLNTPKNTISLAITLKQFQNLDMANDGDDEDDNEQDGFQKQEINLQEIQKQQQLQQEQNQHTLSQLGDKNDMTQLGAILYSKRVMGSRILTKKNIKKVCGLDFKNYGAHSNDYENLPFITVAIAIGMEKNEIDLFLNKFDESLVELQKKTKKQ